MNRSRCSNCGYPRLEYVKDGWKCPACDAFYKEETLPAEVAILLSNAYQQLNIQEFQAAEEMFEDIINKYPKSSDAYWGYVCARYGIKYEEDFDGKKIPTCCFPTIESFAKDKSYKKAIDYADNETANWYINQAEYIDRVRETWVNYVSKEPAYDIFICYKDSDEQNGIERTDDSKEAAELYWHLKEKGYSVFYSRESLRDKIGEKYEPYIFGAINTAKVMILYCSKIEYVESTWVKNEWRRYYKKIDSGEKKFNSLIVAYKGFQPSALPGILSSSQCIYNQSKNFFYDIDAKLEQLFNEYKRDKSGFDKRTLTTVSPLHRHKYTDKVIAATCISKGYTEHRCSCGESYRDNWTPLVDHDYVFEKRIDPECEKEGSDIYVCSICGEKRLDTIPAKGHSFGEWIEKKRPSCTDEGIETRQCTVCGSIEERSIPHLSHEWQDPTLVTKNDGQQNYISVCRLCGAEKIILQPALEEYNRTIIERKRLEKARKRKKAIRISLLIIAVLAVLSYIGIRFVRSESEIKYNLTDNGTYSFDVGMFYKYPESFTVPSTYNRKAVTKIADNAFCDEKEIKEIYIPSSITELGTNVFANTSNDLMIKLETVQKDGYDFLGWEFNNQLITQSDGVVIDNYSLNCGGKLAPKFAAQQNTIVFNGNGADNALLVSQAVLTDETTLLNKNEFHKEGYVFSGWSTTIGGDVMYSDESEYQMSANGSIVLYAVWKPAINELIFDGNGAKSGIMDSMTLEVNSSVSLPINRFTRDGYQFAGWSLEKDGKIIYSDGAEFIMKNDATVILYAVWEKGAYLITYDLDGGVESENRHSYDVDTPTFILNTPVKEGYTFIGWTGTELSSATNKVTINIGSTGNRTYTAHWEANTNTLKFDANGGTGTMSSVKAKTSETVKLPSCSFTRNGYQFIGWSTRSDGKVAYNDKGKYTVGTKNVTLYAIWEKGAYSITYNLDGGTVSGNKNTYDIDTATFTLATPTKAGYTFAGWTGTGLSAVTKTVTINKGSTGNRTYTAHWEANTNTLKFDANGGTGTMSSVKAKTSETVKLPSCSFTRNGYQFIGWATSSGGKVSYNNNSNFSIGTTDVTLYAIWEKGAYSITYNLGGGTVSGNKNTYDVDTATFTLTAPTKAGYTFTGWTGTGLSAVTKTVTINKGSSGNRTYTAHWEANTNTLKFDANGGTGTMADVTIKTDAVSTLPANKLTKSGYTFAGWSITKGGAVVYSDKSSYKMGTSATNVLYAVWKIETYSISYNLNGGTDTTNRKEYNIDTATFSLTAPAREGYTFTGWTGTGLSAVTKNVSVVRGSTGNRSYQANWSKITYSITYTFNGGNDPNNAASYDIETNSFTLFNPTKTGYVFAGWTGTGLSAVTKNVTINKGSVGNRQYSANWEIENYTIHYDLDGGTVANAVNSYNITTSSFSLPVPQKSGYTFVGWSGSNISGIVENVTVEKGSTGNLGFVANWSANTNVLTLTDGVITKQISAKTDSLLRLPKNEFSKDDVLFAGWSTSNNGEILYYDQDLYKMGTASHYTLYAIFKEDTYEYVTDRTGWIAISTPQDLFSIADDLSGKYYLTNDIDMYGYEWTPIGEVFKYKMALWYDYRKTDNAFRGILDGNGHAIYNLHSVGKEVYKEDVDYGDSTHNYRIIYGAGLFGYMEGKVINLQIINAKIEYTLHQNQLYYYDPHDLRGGAITTNWADFQFGIISAYGGVFHNCYAQGDLIFSSSPLPTDRSQYIRDVKFGGIAGMILSYIGCDFTNCSADIRIISQREGQIGELCPSSELVALSYESETYNAFDRGYIWYALGNGTYRYQNAKYHSLVKTLDCIETKEGYTFAGWAISKGGSVKYRVGNECYIPYEDDHLILYPVWKAN